MKKNLQEERFKLFKKRALSTRIFLRTLIFREYIPLIFLLAGVGLLVSMFDLPMYKSFYKTRFAETLATKTEHFDVSPNYNSTVNGRPELVFQYSFKTRLGKIYIGNYKTFNHNLLKLNKIPVIYNKENPSYSKIMTNEDSLATEIFHTFFFLILPLIFLSISLPWLFLGLRKGIKERKLLSRGILTKGILVNTKRTSIVFNGMALNRLVYAFEAKDGKQYQCEELTKVPPSCLSYSCKGGKDIKKKLARKDKINEGNFKAHVLYLPEDPSQNCLLALMPAEPKLDSSGVFR